MVFRKKTPTIYVSWVREHLIGEHLCKWAVWHKTFNDYKKTPSNFDSVGFQIKHTEILNKVLSRYISAGYKEVIPEKEVYVRGEIALLRGKIDLLALDDERPLLIEIKSRDPRPADKIQLLIYLWMMSKMESRFKNIRFDGLLIYPNYELEVSASDIEGDFITNFYQFMHEITHGEPDRKYPNKNQCKFCKIADCDERIEKEELDESDYISPYF